MTRLLTQRRVQLSVRAALVASLVGVVAFAGIASASKSPHTSKPASAKVVARKVVEVRTVSGFGKVLTTTSGRALYTYASDKTNHSACTGSCLVAWPALTVGANVRPTGTAGIGKFRRSKTVFQVTLHGRPLYTFSGDTSPGTVHGNGVANFHVVTFGHVAPSPKGTTTTTYKAGY